MTRLITRRGVLLTLAGGAGGVALIGAGSLVACNRTVTADARAVTERLAATLPEVFAPDRLARHWPGPAGADALTHEILRRPGLVAAMEMDCIASRRAAVRAEFAREFAVGDIVVADRLLVARSECLIAALCLSGVRAA